jgi:hypothetical protein
VKLLSANRTALSGAGRIKPGEFQEGYDAGILFSCSLMKNHNFSRTFLLDHTAP